MKNRHYHHGASVPALPILYGCSNSEWILSVQCTVVSSTSLICGSRYFVHWRTFGAACMTTVFISVVETLARFKTHFRNFDSSITARFRLVQKRLSGESGRGIQWSDGGRYETSTTTSSRCWRVRMVGSNEADREPAPSVPTMNLVWKGFTVASKLFDSLSHDFSLLTSSERESICSRHDLK